MKEKYNQIILTIAVLSGIFLGSYLGFNFLKQRKIEIINEARFQCSQSSRYETTVSESGKAVIVSYPVNDLYLKCLKEKGL